MGIELEWVEKIISEPVAFRDTFGTSLMLVAKFIYMDDKQYQK